MPSGDHLPHLPDPRRSSPVEVDEAMMRLRQSSEKAAMQVLISFGMNADDARSVFRSIFQLGFSSGKLEGYQEGWNERKNAT
jgi:hypothetical protein